MARFSHDGVSELTPSLRGAGLDGHGRSLRWQHGPLALDRLFAEHLPRRQRDHTTCDARGGKQLAGGVGEPPTNPR
jgi:hypothetical protein